MSADEKQLARIDQEALGAALAQVLPGLLKNTVRDLVRAETQGLQRARANRESRENPIIDGDSDLHQVALISVMGCPNVKLVRDDNGVDIWPFVKGEPYWRGPLRRTPDGMIQMARFYPDDGRIEWGSPLDPQPGTEPDPRC